MQMTPEHIAAVERAAGRATASETQWKDVATACAGLDGKRYYEATKHAADANTAAARLAEVADYLRLQARRGVWDLDVAALPAAPTQQGDE